MDWMRYDLDVDTLRALEEVLKKTRCKDSGRILLSRII
jgi:hypothetical protein